MHGPRSERMETKRQLLRRRKASLRSILRRCGALTQRDISLEDLGAVYDKTDLIAMELARTVSQHCIPEFYEGIDDAAKRGRIDNDLNNKLLALHRKYTATLKGIPKDSQAEKSKVLEEWAYEIAKAFRHRDYIFCEAGRPASAGIIEYAFKQRGIDGEIFLTVSNTDDQQYRSAGILYGIGDARTKAKAAAVNMCTVLSKMCGIIETWLLSKKKVWSALKEADNPILGYSRVKASNLERAVSQEWRTGRRGNAAHQMPIDECLQIVARRELIRTFTNMICTGGTDDISHRNAVNDFLFRLTNMFLRGTLMHEATHLLTVQRLDALGIDINEVPVIQLEKIAYLGAAVYSNPAVAFISLCDYISNLDAKVRAVMESGIETPAQWHPLKVAFSSKGYLDLRDIFSEIPAEVDELGIRILLQNGRFLKKIARVMLDKTCHEVAGIGYEEFFTVTMPDGTHRINPLHDLQQRWRKSNIINPRAVDRAEKLELIMALLHRQVSRVDHASADEMNKQQIRA